MLEQPSRVDEPPVSIDPEQARRLVQSLRSAFADGRTRSIDWRKRQLRALKAMLHERKEAFQDALRADLGRCEFETWLAEIGFLDSEIEYALKHLSEWVKPERVSTPLVNQPARSYIQREPLGVVLVIGPWNYPIHLVLAPLIGALAAGNCAVLKPSELAPRSAAALAEWVPKYMDDDCIKVVQGGAEETQALLAQRWDHIFYTGGGRVGRIVMEAAAKHLTPVTLELGGKSPAVVDRDVDLDVAARRIVWGKFFNAGQTCISPDYVLADESIERPLLDRMGSTIKEFYGDEPRNSPDYARIINERHFERLRGLLSDGEVVHGGQSDAGDRYIAPTVLRGVSSDAPVMQDEIFGPILPVLRVSNAEEAIERINTGPKPLALYVFSKNRRIIRDVVEGTSSGGVCVNDTVAHLAVPELPFGGVGDSGMGAYHGRTGFETFSHRKGVLDKGTKVDPALRYPPYDERKLKWAKRLV